VKNLKMERTIFLVNDIKVHAIPPRTKLASIKTSDWDPNPIFTGKLRLLQSEGISIRLESDTGELFAETGPIQAGSVEATADSSRYFMIRVVQETGRHAFVGIGFTERSQAFDFAIALQDGTRQEKAVTAVSPVVDYKLKDGEMIKVNLSVAKKSSSTFSGGTVLPPPPSSHRTVAKTTQPTTPLDTQSANQSEATKQETFKPPSTWETF
jgi:hypothetical protein